MTIRQMQDKRNAYNESGNFVAERLLTLVIWRKLHGINRAANLAAKWTD